MGNQQFNNQTQISAVSSKNVKYIDATSTTDITAGSNLRIDVYAPVGKIAKTEIFLLLYEAIPGALSGEKAIRVLAAIQQVGLSRAITAYNASPYYDYGEWNGVYNEVLPSDKGAQFELQRGNTFDSTNSLSFLFSNSTDVNDVGIRKIVKMWVAEEKIS
jgi:hypothetical protein